MPRIDFTFIILLNVVLDVEHSASLNPNNKIVLEFYRLFVVCTRYTFKSYLEPTELLQIMEYSTMVSIACSNLIGHVEGTAFTQ